MLISSSLHEVQAGRLPEPRLGRAGLGFIILALGISAEIAGAPTSRKGA